MHFHPRLEYIKKSIKILKSQTFRFLRIRHPEVYKLIVGILGTISLYVRHGIFIKNGNQAHWRLQELTGEAKLVKYWVSSHSKDNPLKIPLEKIIKLDFSNEVSTPDPQIHSFNPSIIANNQGLLVTWRISDVYFHPATNQNGEQITPLSTGLLNGIGLAEIHIEDLLTTAKLRNIKVLIEPVLEKRNTNHVVRDTYGRHMEFEDPRFLSSTPLLLMLHGKYVSKARARDSLPKYEIAILDVESDAISILNLTNKNNVEKNWVPILSEDSAFKILRSTQPFEILNLRKQDLALDGDYVGKKSQIGFLHNGSNFLLISKQYYIRVVRETLTLKGLRGVRVNRIIIHDLELNETARTKPFLFTDFGFEICNSLTEYGNKVFFAWGMNDESGYIGFVDKIELIDWIFLNQT